MMLKNSKATPGLSVVILSAVSVAFCILLSLVDWWTYPRIAKNEFRKFAILVATLERPILGSSKGANPGRMLPASRAQIALLRPVFPEAETYSVIGNAAFAGHSADILKASDGNTTIGYAIHGYAAGYHGLVHTLVTTDPSFNVKSVQVLDHTETEGYSDRFEARSFLRQFLGKSSDHLRLGSGIDAVSGATISCRAVTNGVAAAVEFLKMYIMEGGEAHPGSASASADVEQASNPGEATSSDEVDQFGGKDGALSYWHKDKGVGCQLCHLEEKPPYSSDVPTKTCLGCHKNGFSTQPTGEKMLTEAARQLEAAPGGKAMLAATDQKFLPAHDKSDPVVMLRLQYRATKSIEDSRPNWAVRAVYAGKPSDPHISHIPISDCGTCHHIHRRSEDQCGTPSCHPNFTYKMR
jgi:Na+-translocating ferredoxin:NAD+ oxidoreductase subunit G